MTLFEFQKSALTRVLQSLLVGVFTVTSVIGAPGTGAVPPNSGQTSATLPDSQFLERLFVPQKLGMVKEIHQALSEHSKIVVHIQDAHCNFEAQTNIQSILERLIHENTIDLVAVEGAKGFLQIEPFSTAASDSKRRKVCEDFMKKGLLTGSEALGVEKLSEMPFRIYGVEDKQLYLENFKALRDTLGERRELTKFCGALRQILERLKTKIYSPALLAFDAKQKAQASKNLDFMEYVLWMAAQCHPSDLSLYPNIRQAISLTRLEKSVDFKALESERQAVLEKAEKILVQEDSQNLMNTVLDFKIQKVSEQEYWAALEEAITQMGFAENEPPNMKKYLQVSRAFKNIQMGALMNEAGAVEQALKESLCENEEQKQLAHLDKVATVLDKITSLEITREELKFYKDHQAEFEAESIVSWPRDKADALKISYSPELKKDNHFPVTVALRSARSFYEAALKRDDALFDNLLQVMEETGKTKAVIVSGGFHSDGLVDRFRQKDISYAVIAPSITKDTSSDLYFRIMTDSHRDAEDVLGSLAQNLSPAVMLPNELGIPVAARALFEKALGEIRAGKLTDPTLLKLEDLKNLAPDQKNTLNQAITSLLESSKDPQLNAHLQQIAGLIGISAISQSAPIDTDKTILRSVAGQTTTLQILQEGVRQAIYTFRDGKISSAYSEPSETLALNASEKKMSRDEAFDNQLNRVLVETHPGGLVDVKISQMEGTGGDVWTLFYAIGKDGTVSGWRKLSGASATEGKLIIREKGDAALSEALMKEHPEGLLDLKVIRKGGKGEPSRTVFYGVSREQDGKIKLSTWTLEPDKTGGYVADGRMRTEFNSALEKEHPGGLKDIRILREEDQGKTLLYGIGEDGRVSTWILGYTTHFQEGSVTGGMDSDLNKALAEAHPGGLTDVKVTRGLVVEESKPPRLETLFTGIGKNGQVSRWFMKYEFPPLHPRNYKHVAQGGIDATLSRKLLEAHPGFPSNVDVKVVWEAGHSITDPGQVVFYAIDKYGRVSRQGEILTEDPPALLSWMLDHRENLPRDLPPASQEMRELLNALEAPLSQLNRKLSQEIGEPVSLTVRDILGNYLSGEKFMGPSYLAQYFFRQRRPTPALLQANREVLNTLLQSEAAPGARRALLSLVNHHLKVLGWDTAIQSHLGPGDWRLVGLVDHTIIFSTVFKATFQNSEGKTVERFLKRDNGNDKLVNDVAYMELQNIVLSGPKLPVPAYASSGETTSGLLLAPPYPGKTLRQPLREVLADNGESLKREFVGRLGEHAALGDILGRNDRKLSNTNAEILNGHVGAVADFDVLYLLNGRQNYDWILEDIRQGTSEINLLHLISVGRPDFLKLLLVDFFKAYRETWKKVQENQPAIQGILKAHYPPDKAEEMAQILQQRLSEEARSVGSDILNAFLEDYEVRLLYKQALQEVADEDSEAAQDLLKHLSPDPINQSLYAFQMVLTDKVIAKYPDLAQRQRLSDVATRIEKWTEKILGRERLESLQEDVAARRQTAIQTANDVLDTVFGNTGIPETPTVLATKLHGSMTMGSETLKATRLNSEQTQNEIKMQFPDWTIEVEEGDSLRVGSVQKFIVTLADILDQKPQLGVNKPKIVIGEAGAEQGSHYNKADGVLNIHPNDLSQSPEYLKNILTHELWHQSEAVNRFQEIVLAEIFGIKGPPQAVAVEREYLEEMYRKILDVMSAIQNNVPLQGRKAGDAPETWKTFKDRLSTVTKEKEKFSVILNEWVLKHDIMPPAGQLRGKNIEVLFDAFQIFEKYETKMSDIENTVKKLASDAQNEKREELYRALDKALIQEELQLQTSRESAEAENVTTELARLLLDPKADLQTLTQVNQALDENIQFYTDAGVKAALDIYKLLTESAQDVSADAAEQANPVEGTLLSLGWKNYEIQPVVQFLNDILGEAREGLTDQNQYLLGLFFQKVLAKAAFKNGGLTQAQRTRLVNGLLGGLEGHFDLSSKNARLLRRIAEKKTLSAEEIPDNAKRRLANQLALQTHFLNLALESKEQPEAQKVRYAGNKIFMNGFEVDLSDMPDRGNGIETENLKHSIEAVFAADQLSPEERMMLAAGLVTDIPIAKAALQTYQVMMTDPLPETPRKIIVDLRGYHPEEMEREVQPILDMLKKMPDDKKAYVRFLMEDGLPVSSVDGIQAIEMAGIDHYAGNTPTMYVGKTPDDKNIQSRPALIRVNNEKSFSGSLVAALGFMTGKAKGIEALKETLAEDDVGQKTLADLIKIIHGDADAIKTAQNTPLVMPGIRPLLGALLSQLSNQSLTVLHAA